MHLCPHTYIHTYIHTYAPYHLIFFLSFGSSHWLISFILVTECIYIDVCVGFHYLYACRYIDIYKTIYIINILSHTPTCLYTKNIDFSYSHILILTHAYRSVCLYIVIYSAYIFNIYYFYLFAKTSLLLLYLYFVIFVIMVNRYILSLPNLSIVILLNIYILTWISI